MIFGLKKINEGNKMEATFKKMECTLYPFDKSECPQETCDGCPLKI